MDEPRISVVVTAFNHAPYIGTALESVLSQTHPPNEVLVVDDGSSDDTGTVVSGFGHRVRYIRQDNRGVAGARNTGVALATGSHVAFLDGDDVWHRSKLKAQAAAWMRHPEAGIVAVECVAFSTPAPDECLVDYSAPETLPDIDCRPRLTDLIESNFIATTSQVLIPMDVLRDVGRSDERYRTCSDFDLYLRIASHRPVAVVRAPLCFWRYLPTSASGPRDARSLAWYPELAAILRRNGPGLPEPGATLARRRARKYIDEIASLTYARLPMVGRLRTCLALLAHARNHPLQLKCWAYVLAAAMPDVASNRFRSIWRAMRESPAAASTGVGRHGARTD